MITTILFYGITGTVAFYLFTFVLGVLTTDFSLREAAKMSVVIVAALVGSIVMGVGLICLVTWAGHHIVGVPADLGAWWRDA